MTALTQIRIVMSVALTDAYFEFRKKQYIESFEKLSEYGIVDVYVVEALKKKGPTFLDDYTKNAFYSSANDPSVKNNGINEARTLLEGFYHFDFDQDDKIIKLTGRYQLISDCLIKLVEDNPEYDAFVKVNSAGNVFTLGFAMRCKYFKEMYEQIDYHAMEANWINIEEEVGKYIKKKLNEGNFKVLYIDKLGIKANLYGSSTAHINKEDIRYY